MRVLDFCEDKGYIYIVFELVQSGDLKKNLRLIKHNLPTLSFTAIEGAVANIMHQVILAITFLHKQGCVHRDLKPENVLVKWERVNDNESRATCKVTDFGFAKVYKQDTKMKLQLGTAPYMAPELLRRSEYDETVDIWAIGVMAFYLLFNKLPFRGINVKQVSQSVELKTKEPDYVFSKNLQISKKAKNFIH